MMLRATCLGQAVSLSTGLVLLLAVLVLLLSPAHAGQVGGTTESAPLFAPTRNIVPAVPRPIRVSPEVTVNDPTTLSSSPVASFGPSESSVPSAPSAEPGTQPLEPEFFEQLPDALDPEGRPAMDYPEAQWDRAFAQAQAPPPDETEEAQPWAQSRGFIEYRGLYSTNIDLTAPDFDSDLRVKPPTETEVSDWSNAFSFGYDHERELVPDKVKSVLSFRHSHTFFADELREDRSHYGLEWSVVNRYCPGCELEVFFGLDNDNREPDAEYYRQEYWQFHTGFEHRYELSETTEIGSGYTFRRRNYRDDFTIPDSPSEISPYYDWEEHRVWGSVSKDLSDTLLLDWGLTFVDRGYDSLARDSLGASLDGLFRKSQTWEPHLGLTMVLNERTSILGYYRYRNRASTGDFYDYDQHTFGLAAEHTLCPERIPGLSLVSLLEYSERHYDHQVATPVQSEREDERVTFSLGLERTFSETLSGGIDYHYVDNNSNDETSRYQEDRYGIFIRKTF